MLAESYRLFPRVCWLDHWRHTFSRAGFGRLRVDLHIQGSHQSADKAADYDLVRLPCRRLSLGALTFESSSCEVCSRRVEREGKDPRISITG